MKKLKHQDKDGEDFNVREEHGQIMREFSEPKEIYRAIPWWLKHGLYGPLSFWFIWYISMYFGGFDSEEYYEGYRVIDYSENVDDEDNQALASSDGTSASGPPNGAKTYTAVCAVCHQPNGQGLAGVFPPLAGSDWVKGNDQVLAALVLHGLQGEVTVNGTSYNGVMPPQGLVLKDADIAAVLTHIRASWGNGAEPVSVETVAKIRSDHPERTPWTQAELDTTFTE